jgi:hypothetical protein
MTDFTKTIASCDVFLANAVCWCCAWHPAMQVSGIAFEEPESADAQELASRKPSHRAMFSWQTQFAGAAHGILPCSHGRSRNRRMRRSLRRILAVATEHLPFRRGIDSPGNNTHSAR